jgi:hypothetical protein
VLSRFPRGKGTLLDLEFLEDGMNVRLSQGINPLTVP